MHTLNTADLKAAVLARAEHDDYRLTLLADPATAIAQVVGSVLPADFTFDLATELGLTDNDLEEVADDTLY